MEEVNNNILKAELIKKFNYYSLFNFDIKNHVQLISVPSKEHIIKDTHRSEFLFYLIEGKAKLYETLENGNIILIDFFTPPCFIGEIEMIDKYSPPLNVQAIENCLLLAIPSDILEEKLWKDQFLLRNILLDLSQKNIRNIKSASRNQSFTLAKRLAFFILLTEQNGVYDEDHTQASQYLGVSYRHLLYVLADFVKKEYIIKDIYGYKILDFSRLQNLAKGVS